MATPKNITGIILAAGKGTRFKNKGTNKTVSLFNKKPLIQYGIDLYKKSCSDIVIVVGAYCDSVINAISKNDALLFAYQKKRLGTGHALIVALREIENNGLSPELVLLGYGDHMMFYTKEIVRDLVKAHDDPKTAISLISTHHKNPSSLAWGRVLRDKNDHVVEIIEEKDATPAQRKNTELNAGFYCFNYKFLKKNYRKMHRSEVTGEYYLTDFIRLAHEAGKVTKPVAVSFESVGFGINTRDDIEKGEKLTKFAQV